MKTQSKFLSIYCSLMVCLALRVMNAAEAAAFTPKLIEAEQGSYAEFTLVADGTASNGKYLKIGSSGKVSWNITMEHAGWYLLKFRYRAPAEQVTQFAKTDRVSKIGFGYTSTWAINEWRTKLSAGENILQLSPDWGNGMDLDYVEIDSVAISPTMAPLHNTIYIDFPRDIVAKINTYGRAIVAVTANGQSLAYELDEYPHQEDAYWLRIKQAALAMLPLGSSQLRIELSDGEILTMNLAVLAQRLPAPLTIIVPDVSHGAAVLILLPTGKTLLVDCATAMQRDQTLIPFLLRHQIEKIDYFILTHYHEDHDAEDGGQKIRTQFQVDHFYDNTTVKAGQTLDIERTNIKILNAGMPPAGADLNPTSIAFRLEYKGFVYHHGGDCYAGQQTTMLNAFPGDIRAHIFHANHHFHGSSDVTFMRTMDPYLVLVQAEQAIYARSTYMMVFKKQTAEWLRAHNKRFIEDLPCLEVGTIVIRAYDENNWCYETYFPTQDAMVPYLPQTMSWSEDPHTPPQFAQRPNDSLVVAANEVTVEFATDKRAEVRYDMEDKPFEEMAYEFTTGQGAIYHTVTLHGQHGECRRYFIRCRDLFGNVSPTAAVLTVTYDLSLTPIHWYEPNYPDRDWKLGQGPVGYGNANDLTTCHFVRTLYLRKSFELTDSVKALGVLLQGHDGIIAYINGRMIASLNMATNEPTYDTYANNAPTSPITKVVVLDEETLKCLHIGQNVLAVEVHQADVSQPTISADARVFNNVKIYADLKGNWRYYDFGNSPPVLTFRDVYTDIESPSPQQPEQWSLLPNYPNPCNPATTIPFTMPMPAQVQLLIYNLLGQEVCRLLDGELPAGHHAIYWDGRDRFGRSLASGIYLYRLQGPGFTLVRKMLLLR